MLQCPTIPHSIKTLVDGGIAITLHTPELDSDEIAKLFLLKGKQMWTCLKEVEVRPDDLDIPEVIPEFEKDRSPSQRLRARMYVYFMEVKMGKKEDFNAWYTGALDKIGQAYLEKMD